MDPGPRAPRRGVDERRRRRGRPAGGGGRERRRDGARRRARRAARGVLDRLRLRRDEGRPVRRVGRAGPALGLRPHEARTARPPPASARGSSAPRGSSARRATTSCARCSGSAPSGTRSRWSTTSAAARPTSGISPTATRELVDRGSPFGIWHLAASGDCTWADFAEAIFEEAGLDVPGTADHVRRVRREGAAPGDLDPAEREGRPGASALARGPPRLPPRAVARYGISRPSRRVRRCVSRNVLVVSTSSTPRARCASVSVRTSTRSGSSCRSCSRDSSTGSRTTSVPRPTRRTRPRASPPSSPTSPTRAREKPTSLLAIQDALATFSADEIVVALHPEDEAPFVERVAQADLRPSVDGVPVRAIVIRDSGSARLSRARARNVPRRRARLRRGDRRCAPGRAASPSDGSTRTGGAGAE